jgi:hypothetical protein
MESGDSHGRGSGGTGSARRVVLELVICGSEPLSGQVGPAGIPDRIPFWGWIDLMNAIRILYDDGGNPPMPADHSPAGALP